MWAIRDLFEQIAVMKSAWQGTVVDSAAINSQMAKEVILTEFSDLLQAENDAREWDKEDDEFMLSDLLDPSMSDWLIPVLLFSQHWLTTIAIFHSNVTLNKVIY